MENYKVIYAALEESGMLATDFLDAITNWLGTGFLDDEFMEFLKQEGILEE